MWREQFDVVKFESAKRVRLLALKLMKSGVELFVRSYWAVHFELVRDEVKVRLRVAFGLRPHGPLEIEPDLLQALEQPGGGFDAIGIHQKPRINVSTPEFGSLTATMILSASRAFRARSYRAASLHFATIPQFVSKSLFAAHVSFFASNNFAVFSSAFRSCV